MTNEIFSSQIDESQCRLFEGNRRRGKICTIDDFLPSADHQSFLPTLEELVNIELEFEWKSWIAGNALPLCTEQYIARYPVLSSPQIVRRIASHEFYVRSRFGDKPDAELWLQRFPDHFDSPGQILESLSGEILQEQLAGRYERLTEHARGGFGSVWKVRDDKLGRVVALKELNQSCRIRKDLRRRFTEEARIAARLEHPGIVPVYDLEGIDGDAPYYTMKLLEGETLAEAIERTTTVTDTGSGSAIEQRRLLDAFLVVVRALEFAHAKSVVHRDLKPQNIILGEFGETVVLDWGLAKVLGNGDAKRQANPPKDIPSGLEETAMPEASDTSEQVLDTRHGTIIGTPAYMSPEQASGDVDRVDSISDIYSLGATLFHILTGVAPLPEQLGKLNDRAVRRPLASICRRAMMRDRALRYQSVRDLRFDLEAFLADEPVRSHIESLPERIGRWSKRHRSLMVGSGVVAIVMLVALSVIAWLTHRARVDEGIAMIKVQRENARANVERDRAETALAASRENLYYHRMLLARHEFFAGNVVRAKDLLAACPEDLRGWEWHYVNNLTTVGVIGEGESHDTNVRCVEYDPTGRRYASASSDGVVKICDADTRELIGTVRHGILASVVVFSSDGEKLFTAGAEQRGIGEVKEWLVESGELVATYRSHQSYIYGLDVSTDGKWLASCSQDRTIVLYDLTTKEEHRLEGHKDVVQRVSFSPDGSRIASAGRDRTVRVWNVSDKKLMNTYEGHTHQVNCVEFHPEGKWLASASSDHSIRLWDTSGERKPWALHGHSGYVWDLAFHPGGKSLLSASFDRTIRSWKFSNGTELARYVGHQSHVRTLAIAPNAEAIISGGGDGKVLQWRVPPDDVAIVGTCVTIHPDGRRLVTGSGKTAFLWDPETNARIRSFEGHTGTIHNVAVSPDGARLATASGDHSVKVWNLETGQLIFTLEGHEDEVAGVVFTLTGDEVVSSSLDGTVRSWNLHDGALKHVMRGHDDKVFSLALSPVANQVASTSQDETVRVWDLDSSEQVLELTGHCGPVVGINYSSSGSSIATTSSDGTVRVWDAQSGLLLHTLQVGNTYVNDVHFSPDESRLVAGSEDSLIVWETKNYQQVFAQSEHQCIHHLDFSPDGSTIVLAGQHKNVRLLKGGGH